VRGETNAGSYSAEGNRELNSAVRGKTQKKKPCLFTEKRKGAIKIRTKERN